MPSRVLYPCIPSGGYGLWRERPQHGNYRAPCRPEGRRGRPLWSCPPPRYSRPNFLPSFISWLPEGMPFSLAHLPKSLLLGLLAFAPSWFSEVSALQGDSWCGTLMCVSATVNASTVTCMRRILLPILSPDFSARHRRAQIPQSTRMDGDVSRFSHRP